MNLLIDKPAPDINLPSTAGNSFKLSDQKGKTTILYFFPRDFTPGCTIEACTFRDEMETFRNLNIDVFGISKDSLETHLLFKDKYSLPFDLLSDVDGEVAKSYGALVPILGVVKRVSYLIDDELMLRYKYSSLFNAAGHIQNLLGQVIS
jgi:thioredoxin-dependent peroxiredoxin